MSYLLALDAGTTSNRAILFDGRGQVLSQAQREFSQYFPQPGWVEQDPVQIYSTMLGVAVEAISQSGIQKKDIQAIGITNQRETTILWDKKTGQPVHRAIVWQCRRTTDRAEALRAAGLTDLIQKKTGLVIDAYFSATKIAYILDQVPGLRDRAKRGEIAFGTVDSYLIYRLTGGRTHATDVSNACRTMLYNIHTEDWDQEILDILDIPREILPQVYPSSHFFGHSQAELLGREIPITGVLGDQQAALFGQACFEPGEAKNTYGTGAFVLMNTGHNPIPSSQGLLTSIAWKMGQETTYALEGSIFVAGSLIQWLRDQLGLMEKASQSEAMARSVEDTHGLMVVPAFTGLGAPYWNSKARGSIVGLSRGANKNHLVRASLEAIALLSYDVIKTMELDSGLDRKVLKVDGGAAQNNFLMETQANILNAPVIRPRSIESTARGAAFMAGIGSGYYRGLEEIKDLWQEDRVFRPQMDPDLRHRLIQDWHHAVKNCLAWTQREE
ncbi:MAG: glycerol kinase GlpK [Tissierellia bacterium]|nr:glycerol kinase GlpK [Tissierellia bacterium]